MTEQPSTAIYIVQTTNEQGDYDLRQFKALDDSLTFAREKLTAGIDCTISVDVDIFAAFPAPTYPTREEWEADYPPQKTRVMRQTELRYGNTLRTDTNHEKLWQKLVEFYSQRNSPRWECPWCGGDIDASSDEHDGDEFWDTWTCVGDCNLLITFITPAEYKEYHQVPDGQWTILVESAFGGDWFAPDEADDLVED